MQYVVTAPVVKVSIGSPGGNRVASILRAGALVPDGVDEAQLTALAKRGMLEKLVGESEGFPSDPSEVPNKSAKVGEWRAHVVAAGLATEQEVSKATKEELVKLVEAKAAPPAPPAGNGSGGQVPPVPPVDPVTPPLDPVNPADPVNPGNGSEGQG